jgi:hypothetical protein
LERATSAQVLAFVDSVMDTKIFAEPIEYWKEEFINSQRFTDLNEEFSDSNQLIKMLYNEESLYDIKSCLAVKKLDNSIYQFKELSNKAQEIIRERTRIWKLYKMR